MKILLISDCPLYNTGYSVIIRRLAGIFLSLGHHVEQIAWGLKEEIDYKYKLHPVPNNDFGKTIFTKVVDDLLPDIVFAYGDLMNISYIGQYKNRFFRFLGYFPVDSEQLTTAQKYIVNQMDMPITYSKTGLNATINATQREDTRLIYHGVDPEVFRPMNKEAIKRKYGLSGKFVVGSVGRNSERKNFPALIKSFADFAKDKNDVVLYLHTKPIDVGHNLYEHIMRNNIQDKVYITKDLNVETGVDEKTFVEIYNLMDIYASSTSGEGLMLPSLEAQLCEVPVLVTDYSACKEFVSRNMRINTVGSYFLPLWDTERQIISSSDLTEKLNIYYKNRSVLPVIGKECRKYCEAFDWKYITPLWEYVIRELAGIIEKDGLEGFNTL